MDDPTRMLRGLRFAGRFGWKAAPKTKQLFLQADREQALLLISRERFSQEFLKVLGEEKIKPVFDYLIEFDLLKFAWPSLTWHPGLPKLSTPEERLGLLVCSLGENGAGFLRSLHQSKELSRVIKEISRVEEERMTPLIHLNDFQRRVLQTFFPRLPAQALGPCVLKGQDLKDLGIYGRSISNLLVSVRKAQWEGKIATREEALKLIRP